MFDKRKFLAQMTLIGVTYEQVARHLGINRITLARKIDNNGSFTREEIFKLIEFLHIENPAEIFFVPVLTETRETY